MRRLRGRLREVLRRGARDEDGSTLVEFAVSLSVLMLFTFALMEMCVAFYTCGMLSECAREGTRYAILRGSTCTTSSGTSCSATTTQIQTYVTGLTFPNPGGGTIAATASFPNTGASPVNGPGNPVKVVVTYSFPIRFPLIPTRALSLSAASQMTIIQ